MTGLATRWALCVVGLAVIAGCQSGSSRPAPSPVAGFPPPVSDSQPAPPEKPKESTQAALAHPHTPADTAKTEDGEAPDIGAVGMEESKIRTLFGEPASEEDEAPAKKLRYRAGACSVEFALYPDVDTRTYRTLTLEVSSDDGTAKGKRSCIAELKSRIAAK